MATHYNKGNPTNKIAFILSTPGKVEGVAGRPASGETGANLNAILEILNKREPSLFGSTDRYEYLITNASTEVMHSFKGNGRTEDVSLNITREKNVARIQSEVKNCSIIILCGKKAELLSAYLHGKKLIRLPHLGNKGLRNKYKNSSPLLNGLKTAAVRDATRLRLCADCILEQLHNAKRASPEGH
ncbi:MAG: uracil-DNA glycosylase family protein [Proteobacteria bacterium]|nr:uracil-DNA glycosylase family protein [Pseudomonadota bacterium]MBU1060522.1 uracil-DNA glycosylase family protein [Pseudomonadota bacterium]